ncbi:MAG: hypothetical protein K2I23_07085 [Clostridia bacterium]|nr:hypothetical protein [Clostridia bacterium]
MNNKKKTLIAVSSSVGAVALILVIVLLSVYFATLCTIKDLMEIDMVYLDKSYKTTVEKRDTYLGHPDLVDVDGTGSTLMTFYPSGHGKGAIIGKVSKDQGATWQDMTNLPESWKNSMETPCVYRLDFTDGRQAVVLTSGCPYWAGDGILPDGFNSSVSWDKGNTWSEFEKWYGSDWAEANNSLPYNGVVAMSSLTQLKENGKYIDKWMGTFHRGGGDYGKDAPEAFVNYRTYLTFDGERAIWGTPEPFLAEHRQLEGKYGMCELEIIRNPQNDCLILIARPNNRVSNALICYSYDEGITWTSPKELPNTLTGDRHKAEYDPVSGKVIISFRQVLQKKDDSFKKSALSTVNWQSEGWVAWIGDFDDLMSFANDDPSKHTYGDALLVVGKNYTAMDCGYSGVVILNDGTVIMDSYGYFSRTATKPYIMQAKFKIADVIK